MEEETVAEDGAAGPGSYPVYERCKEFVCLRVSAYGFEEAGAGEEGAEVGDLEVETWGGFEAEGLRRVVGGGGGGRDGVGEDVGGVGYVDFVFAEGDGEEVSFAY